MASSTKIEWTEATWNPVVGCTAVSEGCRNCYAATLAGTRLKHSRKYRGLTRVKGWGAVWSGTVRTFDDHTLTAPLRWKKPRMVFVPSMGDLFHEDVPVEFIDKVFAVMALCPQHTFQVLTKRPGRMAEYLNAEPWNSIVERSWETGVPSAGDRLSEYILDGDPPWPLPNVWLGTSIENQATADERTVELVECPAAVRFVSCEPLLGAIDLLVKTDAFLSSNGGMEHPANGIDWVIVGGETGPGARPMDPDWARSIRDQCKAAGVPFFFKKMGGGKPTPADLAIREYPLRATEKVS